MSTAHVLLVRGFLLHTPLPSDRHNLPASAAPFLVLYREPLIAGEGLPLFRGEWFWYSCTVRALRLRLSLSADAGVWRAFSQGRKLEALGKD